MPHFYFDLALGANRARDEQGQELGSLAAAEIAAMRTAGEIARDRLWGGMPGTITVEVKDQGRRLVLSISVCMKVDRQPGACGE